MKRDYFGTAVRASIEWPDKWSVHLAQKGFWYVCHCGQVVLESDGKTVLKHQTIDAAIDTMEHIRKRMA